MRSRILRHLAFNDEYILNADRIVGEGFNGRVVKGEHRCSKRPVAVKCLHSAGGLPEELHIYARMSHPNICRLLEAFVEPGGDTWLCMEYCCGGELFEQVAGTSTVMYVGPLCDTEDRVARLVRQMAAAFRYLHGMGIVHRDNKLENWVFASPAQERIKLIDFGFAKLIPTSPEAEKLTRVCGTSYYVAPEVFSVCRGRLAEGSGYGVEVDIWALGVIVYMLISGTAPYTAESEKDILWEIAAPTPDARLLCNPFAGKRWKDVSENCRSLISQCLVRDPLQRLTALRVQEHPWLQVAPSRCSTDLDEDPPEEERVVNGYAASIAPLLGKLLLAATRFVESRILALLCGHIAQRMYLSPELWTIVRDSFFELEGSDELTPKGSPVLDDLVAPCLAFCDHRLLSGGRWHEAQLSREEACRQLLASLDLTGDGRLHFFEFFGALIGAGNIEVGPCDVASAFTALDVDGDGTISAADLESSGALGIDAEAGRQETGCLALPVVSVDLLIEALKVHPTASTCLPQHSECLKADPLDAGRRRSKSAFDGQSEALRNHVSAKHFLSKETLHLPWKVERQIAFDVGTPHNGKLNKSATLPVETWNTLLEHTDEACVARRSSSKVAAQASMGRRRSS